MSSNFNLIKYAIVSKRQCIAMYDGCYREFCPHVIGYAKDGSEACLVYQYGGKTSKGPITKETKDNWRCIKIDGLRDLQVRDGDWHTFGNHSEEQTCIKEVDAEADFGKFLDKKIVIV